MDDLHLFIYGEIGGDSLGESAIGPDEIQQQFQDNSSKETFVHISSPGGAVFKGWTIGNIIKNSGRKTTSLIEGYCASIATFIALSCDRVEMAETGRFVIHNPTIDPGQIEEGDAEKVAEQLASLKDDMIAQYRAKTGLSVGQITSMMDKETSMTAKEAKDFGFVDGFMTPLKAVAKIDIKNMPVTKKAPEVKTDKKAKELENFFDRLLAKGREFMSPQNAEHIMLELADGTFIFVDSEDGELPGKAVFTVDAEGNRTEEPAPDGTHELRDGRSITIEGGLILSVQEASTEVEDLKKENADLKAQLEADKEENKTDKEKADKNLSELMEDVKNLKAMTVGDKGPIAKKHIEPAARINREPAKLGHQLDAFAEYLNSKN